MGIETVGAVLDSLLPIQAMKAWTTAAGPALQKVVEFQGVELREKDFFVKLLVRDSLWRQEMLYQKTSLLESFNRNFASISKQNRYLATELILAGPQSRPGPSRTPQNGRSKSRFKS